MSWQGSFSTPLADVLRGLDYEFGVSGLAFAGDSLLFGFMPLGLRYNFLAGSRVVPYIGLGLGYYVSTQGDEIDHGMQFLHAGMGLTYFLSQQIAIGLGFDARLGGVSLADRDESLPNNYFCYGIRLTVAP